MPSRLALITEIIAPYRIPVFNALASRPELQLHVIFLAETDKQLRQWHIYRDEIKFSYQVLPSWRWRTGSSSLLLNRGLWPALKAANPSAIICGGYNYPSSWAALVWARRRNVPFVLWSESNSQDKRPNNVVVESLKRHFVKSCDAFVVPGRSSFEYIQSLGADGRPIFTAPSVVDNEFFAAHADAARAQESESRRRYSLPKRFFLCVSRFVPEKGIFDLLEAYATLDEGLRCELGLVFAGDGPARAKLVSMAQKVRPGTIVFPGFAQREELAVLYGLSEFLVLPTHSDPWGLVVNEAMACRLPVIVTNFAGCAADLVKDGENGYVVPPRNPRRLSEAIAALARDNELQMQMSKESTERIRVYSPEACAAGLAQAALSPTRQAR